MMIVSSEKSLTMTRKFTYAVLTLLMLAACQKTDIAKSSDDLAIRTPDALIISAKNFFMNDIVTIQSSLASLNNEDFRRHQVSKTPLWEKAYIKHDDTKGDVIVVPLQYEKPLHFKTNFGNGTTLSMEKQSDLWIYKDVSGKNKAEVRIALPDKTYQDGVVKSFEGYIMEEDWFGTSLNNYLYKNGNISIVKKKIPVSGVNNSTNRDIVECDAIDWYICDYIDQYGVGTNCQYLYTEYVNCEGGGDDGGGDNGGGGGGGETENQCAAQCANDFNALVDGTTTASETIDIHVSDINGLTKNKNPEWRILKNLTWALFSHEMGTIEHVTSPEDRWEWRTLAHHSITFAGQAYGGSVSFSQGVGTPSFTAGTSNVLYAGMSVSYTVTYAPLCNCPGVNVILPPTTIPYTSNAIWNANPF
jgi:hypothetical protein